MLIVNAALLGVVSGKQTAVAVWMGTRLASPKLAFLPRIGSAGWASDRVNFLKAEFFLHGGQ
jgi:hypothetical protein